MKLNRQKAQTGLKGKRRIKELKLNAAELKIITIDHNQNIYNITEFEHRRI